MEDCSKYSESVVMPSLFAHSEQMVKTRVRNLRRDFKPASSYKCPMKLRITELRKQKGLTVEALASKAGISKSYLSELANGKKQANARLIDSLSRALGVSEFELMDADSVEPDILEHMRLMQKLSRDDRKAVIGHADALYKSREGER